MKRPKLLIAVLSPGFALLACTVAELGPAPSDASRRDTADATDAAVSDTSVADSANDMTTELDVGNEATADATATDADTQPDVSNGDSTNDAAADASADAPGQDTTTDTDAPDEDATTDTDATTGTDAVTDAGADASTCNTQVTNQALVDSPHIPSCSAVTYATNPPTSGPHYPIWAAYKTYNNPVAPGFFVHCLEHGGIVIQTNCTAAAPCTAELITLQAFLDARPADPLCVAPRRNRFVVTTNAALTTRFAASAWGVSLTSDCFDLPALGAFIDANYAKSPENTCADGVDFDTVGVGSALYCPPAL